MPIRVLIADDNEIVRSRLVEIVSAHNGWAVCAAVGNGQEAVEKANELKPDVTVLDLAMPVMDGLSATREILRTLPTLPIVIYTLHNIPAVELEAKKAGARKMVLKPHVELLTSAIEEILANESRGSEAKAVPNSTASSLEVNLIAAASEDSVANKPQDSVAFLATAPPTSAPTPIPASASAAPPDGAETNAVTADGDSTAPPVMGEPEPSA
jgi:two-component system chemotaxis response regulator CheB